MIFLETNSLDPYTNLAFEEYVFDKLDNRHSYFMLWQNRNTIVVGKYQNTAEEINQAYVDANKIQVARRLSGGGAVYHDTGNLNFTFIMDHDPTSNFDFKYFASPVIKTLKEFGITARFNGRNDLTINERKFSGNSQYRRNNRVMHHGCIMLNSNLTNVSQALRVRKSKFESKSVKSVRSRVTTINDNAPFAISMDHFKASLLEQVSQAEDLTTMTLAPDQLLQIQQLRDEKYATWEWNYGFSANYGVRKEQHFLSGTVTAHLQVKAGCIEKIRIFGDFFGNKDIHDLEQQLIGIRLDNHLSDFLENVELNEYIYGLTPDELCKLLIY